MIRLDPRFREFRLMESSFHNDEKGKLPFKEFAHVWAERAGKLALNEIETPNEDNLVTFSTLTLFWYSQGSWRRSFIHKGIRVPLQMTLHVILNMRNRKRTPNCPRTLSR